MCAFTFPYDMYGVGAVSGERRILAFEMKPLGGMGGIGWEEVRNEVTSE